MGMRYDQDGGKGTPVEIDPEAVDVAGALMAHSMIACGNLQQLARIIDAGVSVHTTDEMGCTLLEKACLCGNTAIVQLLLDKGAVAHGLVNKPSTPLHRAAALP